MRMARPMVLSIEQRDVLESRARARSASARSVERARIVLLAAGGMQDRQIAPNRKPAGEGRTLAEPVPRRWFGGAGQ